MGDDDARAAMHQTPERLLDQPLGFGIDVRGRFVEHQQQGWIEGLRQPNVQAPLAFSFLARGVHEENTPGAQSATPAPETQEETPYHQGSVLLNFFSWASENERELFYADPNYQDINRFVSNTGIVRILPLETM